MKLQKIKNWARIKFNTILNSIINWTYKQYAILHLRNTDFCIICNNCYAGHIYETLNRPYNTPTVGLYFFADDYIKFITNLEFYLNEDLQFTSASRFRECYEEHNKLKYPIGILSNNLEIHFLHYKTEKEALSKWNRRKMRVQPDNLMIIMNDQNRFKDEMIGQFSKITYPKVFLSVNQYKQKFVKKISYYDGKQNVGDMYNDKLKVLCDFDLVRWIKNNVK